MTGLRGENLGCPDEAEKEGGERGERGKKRGKQEGRKKKKNCRQSRQNIIFNHNSNKMIIHFPSSTNHRNIAEEIRAPCIRKQLLKHLTIP